MDSQDVIVYVRKSDKKSPFVKDDALLRSPAIDWSSSLSVEEDNQKIFNRTYIINNLKRL